MFLGSPLPGTESTTQTSLEFLEPLRFLFDYVTIMCDEVDTPYDDYIGEISIPVLYLGAAGGIGTTGIYTTTLLGGDDVTALVPSLRPEEEIVSDIGHVDIWTAADSEETFWQPLLEWITDH